MRKRRKWILWTLVAIAAIYILAVSGGGYAYRRPPALNADERRLLSEPPLPYAVIVKPWDSETAARTSQNPLAYAQGVADTLIPSGAFRTSRFEKDSKASDGDLIATSTGIHCNSAVIPLFTILSLGIIPTVFDDEDCEGMELRRPGAAESASPVRIEFHNQSRVVMGLPALFVGILPGWSWGDPRSDSRYRQRFRLEVVSHRSEIEPLMSSLSQ